jgi:hypothetical protein
MSASKNSWRKWDCRRSAQKCVLDVSNWIVHRWEKSARTGRAGKAVFVINLAVIKAISVSDVKTPFWKKHTFRHYSIPNYSLFYEILQIFFLLENHIDKKAHL